ncbi:MAG: hypothetical protein HPZ91_06555 [Lentisphaeria bacterium]|nr:hypothetical protein [Lentisphaeria bacterium]
MILKIASLIAGTLLPAGIISAQESFNYNGWISGQFWGGGYVQNVVPAPSNPARCYAYIDMAGLYRSNDGGNTWRMLHGAFPDKIGMQIRGVSVDPRDADRIAVVVAAKDRFGKGYLLLSTDGGGSFREAGRIEVDNWGRRATGFVIDRNPGDPGEIFVAGYDGVRRSTDNGASYELLFPHPLNPTDLRFDRRNNGRLWLCSPAKSEHGVGNTRFHSAFDPGFYTSGDGGKSWEKLSAESPTEIVQSVSDPHELYGIFDFQTIRRSTDGGRSWSDCSQGLRQTPVEYHDRWCNKNIYTALAAGPDFILTASTLKDLYRLKRGSGEWERVSVESVDPRDYLGAHKIEDQAFKATGSITVDPADPEHWYATDYYNVMQTFDGGKNWRCTSTGLSQVVIQNVFVLPGTHHFLVSLMDHSWYLSRDGGKSFEPYGGFGYERLYIRQSPADPSTVYTSGPRGSTVTVSRDGGKTWHMPAQNGLPENRKHFVRASVAPDSADPGTVYLGVSREFAGGRGGGVYVSRDFGENWSRMSDGLPDPSAHQGKGFFENTNVCGNELAVSKAGTPVAASIVYNIVCRYDRKKGRWETVRNDPGRPWGLRDLQADPFSSRLWLSAMTTGLLYSDDDGRSWKRLGTFPGNAGRLCFDPEKPGRFTVTSPQGLYLTEDGGESWYFCDFELKQPGRSFNSVAAIAGETLLLGTPDSGVFRRRIERNPDGSPRGFVRKTAEKPVHRTAKFNDFFGTGTLRLLPGDGEFTASGGGHTPLFGVRDDSTLRLECADAANYATVSATGLPVKTGVPCTLSFEVRGDISLTGYLSDPKRRDFLSTKLGEEWKSVSVRVVPAADKLSVSLLNWKQRGWFEVRKFALTEE